MSKIPTILRVIGWSAFALLMIMVIIGSVGAAYIKNISDGGFASLTALSMIPICGLIFITFACLFGASHVSKRLKKLAASRGKKMVARIVKTARMGSEGSRMSQMQIVRFDLEVEHEGETVIASTEIKSGHFDASKYPAGTRVSVVYDHDTKTIAMLNKNDYVVEYI